MNAADRKTIDILKGKLADLQSQTEDVAGELRTLADAEQEKFDNLTEGLQQAESGQAIEMAAQTLDDAASAAEDGDLAACIASLDELEG